MMFDVLSKTCLQITVHQYVKKLKSLNFYLNISTPSNNTINYLAFAGICDYASTCCEAWELLGFSVFRNSLVWDIETYLEKQIGAEAKNINESAQF